MAWIGLVCDVIDLIPFVTNLGETVRAVKIVNKTDNVSNTTKGIVNTTRGWKVGDDITNLTKAGNKPSWTTVRNRYRKNEALNNPFKYSTADRLRMSKGLAPIGSDGFSMELHHPNGRVGDDYFNFKPISRTEHMSRHQQWGYKF